MKHIRIKLIGNESRLEYLCPRTGLYEISLILSYSSDNMYNTGITYAYYQLKRHIRFEREALKSPIGLMDKETGAILKLLKQKRRHKANEALESKEPVNLTKHVGVEIEFISSSDRHDIAVDLAMHNLTQFVELKHDGSVQGDSQGDCDGSCRENCECADCGETHYCDNQDDCDRRFRDYHSHGRPNNRWIVNEDCNDCGTETITETDDQGVETTREISNCIGHCEGHSCMGYDDHENCDCECECNCNTSDGHEIAIVAKSSQIAEIVTKVCHVLSLHNAQVNKTCGLHVHIDARKRDQHKMFRNLVRAQRLLYSMVPASRFKNSYCEPNDSEKMDGYSGRYWGINPKSYEEHKTIEVRLHSGTINATKIINWIKLLQAIAYSRRKAIDIVKLSDLTKNVMISTDLLFYISDRLNKFTKGRGDFTIANDLAITKVNSEKSFEESEAA